MGNIIIRLIVGVTCIVSNCQRLAAFIDNGYGRVGEWLRGKRQPSPSMLK